MRVGGGGLARLSIGVGCLALVLQVGLAQKKPVGATPDSTRAVLIQKAHALESRGRPDMAIQLWQQILLSDPQNAESLAGLARDYKLMGTADKSGEALERLRRLNPNDPNISIIEAMPSTRAQSDQLKQAGELARQGKSEDAMRVYRSLYGNKPPDGDIALAYYQTLYGTDAGKQEAIAGMRALAQRNPGDSRFQIELGTMLTYEGRTRPEGIRILRQFPKDSDAETALRQALIWDAANPGSAAELRQYLKDHPQDTELIGHLKQDEAKLAQMNSGIARTPAERAAFAALNAHQLDEAQARFSEILQTEPDNGRVEAGMGFLRMQQKNFGGAISYLTQAEQNGYTAQAVEDALSTSRFWFTMGEATQAFDEGQLDLAATKYQAALDMRPRSPEALNGLAGLLTKQEQYSAAALVYEQLLRAQPGSADAWRGLFLAYARDGQNDKALALSTRFPGPVKSAMAKDPEYLRTLATIYHAQNRPADAQRVLAQALALPFPDNGTNLKTDTKLQYAGILMEAKRFDQAAEMYTQILSDDPDNLSAYMGIVSAHHQQGQDNQAIADVEKMPPAAYESALADPGFLSMLGAIYQQANQFEVAQGFLERSAKIEIAAGGQPSVALQLQIAAIDLQRNNTAQAYAIYRQVLSAYPDRVDAWKGLINTLLVTNRSNEALEEIAVIPAPVRKQLEMDIDFVQSEASLYAAAGDIPHATEYMNRVQSHYAALKTAPPATIEIQNAWLLFNTKNDRALYPALMHLGSRQDLTIPQRETVQDIWANWSVRRAATATENGNLQRAVDILDAASQAFPDNLTVRKAVAGGYVQVGRAKESLALFKTIPMQDASAGDFQGAIGAALAANDKAQAEIWLRQALDRFPRDPAILSLAARFEQARGDHQRAADYWRASLASMPQMSPAAKLAHTLVYPEQDTRARRAVTAADLQRLLDPNAEPFAKTTKLPPLPAYGADPYNGSAPVVLNQPQQAQRPAQWIGVTSAPDTSAYASPSNIAVTRVPVESSQPAYTQQSPAPADAIPGYNAPTPRTSPDLSNYMGRMHVPEKDKNIAAPPANSSPYVPGAVEFGLGAQNPPQQIAAAQPQAQPYQSSAQAAQPPAVAHTLAGDAWKGLIFSLLANNRPQEALEEISKIPPDVRRSLDADIEFVQAQASIYSALGDVPRTQEFLNRVENYYLLRRAQAPSGIEVQHAWLLYNTKDDRDLYALLLRLDARQDLSPAQRQDVQTLWGNWAARRALAAIDSGNTQLAAEILDSAMAEFPDSPNVRKAVAGGYVKLGRATEALAIFKAIPMQEATAADLQGAIAAALAAKDMAQAEAWLRQALAAYPHEAGILASAARFEQASGNNQRATDFWRAALAAMPPGSSLSGLDQAIPGDGQNGVRPLTPPGDLRRLLNPNNLSGAQRTTDLPAYRPSGPSNQSGAWQQPASPAQSNSWPSSTSASSLPLPLPPQSNPAAAQSPQQNQPSRAPVYIPQSSTQSTPPSQPRFVEQKATRRATIKPATNNQQASRKADVITGIKATSSQPTYTGRINLPPSEETVNSANSGDTAPVLQLAQNAPPTQPAPTPRVSLKPPPTKPAHAPNPNQGLRITSQPMENLAAQTQTLFSDQTDSQLLEGSANQVHAIANYPARPAPQRPQTPPPTIQYSVAQYTPSAQEAATGAYSAPKQQTTQPQAPQPQQTTQPAPAPAAPTPTRPRKRARKSAARAPAPAGSQAPTLDNAPAVPQNPQQVEIPTELPQAPAPATSTTGLSDEELQQRSLPPLRGPWVRVQRDNRTVSPRDEAEMQLRSIESGYSGWVGGTGLINYRSGDLGYDQLAALEAPFEVSFPLGYGGRLAIVAKPVFLDSGQADGNSVITVQESTTAGSKLVTIPQPIGTLTATDTTIPLQQNAVGIGGELQLIFPHLALAGGYTPAGFLVATETGRAMWKPGNGPITFAFSRDSVKDTQLSYAGLRDPAGDSLGSQGQIWGGVMANQGNIQFSRGDAESGFYLGGGGQYLTGYQVQTNKRFDGDGGAYWRILSSPENGTLSIGVNFFGMHYAQNEDAFTYGMGGYFSPQAYFLGNVPLTWNGHYLTHWHYNILGSLGAQAFQEDATSLFPLAAQTASEIALNNPVLPAKTSVGPNYDLRGQVAYQISPHWFAGGFLSANNSRNYSSVSAGFSVRFLFRSQPSTVTTPTGLFPSDGLRPFLVP
jgi:tetratricopeptide (TPR) repeat protein